MKELKIFGISDAGMMRRENEDSYWIKDFGDLAVVMVADGMGGAAGGEIASLTAVETMQEAFQKQSTIIQPDSTLPELILQSFQTAHRRIREKGQTGQGNLNMGTTCTMAAITRGPDASTCSVTLGHVGDSKLFQVRGECIVQRSEDHTLLKHMLDVEAVKPEEADNYAHKNIITKSLGGSQKVDFDEPDSFSLEPGDILILCTDGLANYVKREEMLGIINGTGTLKKASQYMVNLANHRGGDDNITVVLTEYGRFKRDNRIKLAKIPKVKRQPEAKERKIAIAILVFVLIILIGLLIFLLKQSVPKETPNRIKGNNKTSTVNR